MQEEIKELLNPWQYVIVGSSALLRSFIAKLYTLAHKIISMFIHGSFLNTSTQMPRPTHLLNTKVDSILNLNTIKPKANAPI